MTYFLYSCTYKKYQKIVMRYLSAFDKNQFFFFRASNLKAQKKYN